MHQGLALFNPAGLTYSPPFVFAPLLNLWRAFRVNVCGGWGVLEVGTGLFIECLLLSDFEKLKPNLLCLRIASSGSAAAVPCWWYC